MKTKYEEELEKGCGKCKSCNHEEYYHYRKEGSSLFGDVRRMSKGDYSHECDHINCNCKKFVPSNNVVVCPECKAKLEVYKKAKEEFNKKLEKLKKNLFDRIKRNGNLKSRIIETKEGEFKNVYDNILNLIVLEVIEEEINKLQKDLKDE